MRIGLTFNARSPAKPSCGATKLSAAARDALLACDDSEEEFDSLETISALADTLRSLGHEVELLGEGESLIRRLLDGPRPDLVFNIAEGRGVSRSRESRVPAILETLGIPYTGSDPLSLAVALDKDCAKRLVAQAGVATPAWVTIDDRWETAPDEVMRQLAELPLPLVVKPTYEGSSKGIRNKCLVETPAELRETIAELRGAYQQPILVEEFIDGDELTVGIVGHPPEVLGIMRVVPTKGTGPFLYSLEIKRDWVDTIRYECPAPVSPRATQRVGQAALAAFRALGCQDVARVDFRLRDDVPYFLEANPLPGLAPFTSDLVFLARDVGVDHRELLRRILAGAINRLGRAAPRTTEPALADRR
ncbi:MAG: ATP-grasp domain-containing protein [Pirellulales bacterium]|nr:ATP-grasp domain-containing protein [Pirellulales bacterium]